MTVPLFMGNDLGAFTRTSGYTTESNDAGRVDLTYIASGYGVRVRGAVTDYVQTPAWASQTTIYAHFDIYAAAFSSGSFALTLLNSTGVEVFRLMASGSSVMQAQYWNGSTWVNTGATIAFPISILTTFDLKVICGASGSFELYANNTLATSGAIASASTNNVAAARLWALANGVSTASNAPTFSQIMFGTASMVGWKLYERRASANSADIAWDGDVLDINESVINDASYATGVVDGDREGFVGSALVLGSGTVMGVGVTARAKKTAGGVANLSLFLKMGGVYDDEDLAALTDGFAPYYVGFANDPETGLPWTKSGAASVLLEYGLKART